MRAESRAVVFSNLQTERVVPFLLAARRLRLATVGYVASWDHTVGKGVISPHMDRYIVQNDVMRDDLVRYHGIAPRAHRRHGLAPDATCTTAGGHGRTTSGSSAATGSIPAGRS